MAIRTRVLAWLMASLAYGVLGHAEDAQVYELDFWPGPNVGSDNRVIQLALHPCGEVAVARVTSLPRPEKGQTLEPELVLELAQNGAVLQRWSMPVDYTPIGIRGSQILVELRKSRLWLDLKDGIARAKDINIKGEPQPVKCETPKDFGNSAYAKCWRFRDLATGKPRTLAFQGVCS
jgi:hypothetical protein